MSDAISLGWNCSRAVNGIVMCLRSTKENGYKTCPFDLMITNYPGMFDCINDDFEYLCDPHYLELIKIPKESRWLNTNGDGDVMIYHKKYKFIFNHESPGHANIHIKQKWENGKLHYVLNGYEEFINKYTRRTQNFRDLLKSNKKITFILTRPQTGLDDISDFTKIIATKYPLLDFKFEILDFNKHEYYEHLLLMKFDANDEEIKRLCI